jgi:hypothetical protein
VSAAKPETVFDMDQLILQLNDSFTTAAVALRNTFAGSEWADSPFVYHMPKMKLSMRLSLSHSDGRVKGFFRKQSTKDDQELVSTVEIEVVAVPRPTLQK